MLRPLPSHVAPVRPCRERWLSPPQRGLRTRFDVSSNTSGSWAAPRILNLLRIVHHHPGSSLSINRATASREMISCATGVGIPHEVEASNAVSHSLPERAKPGNVHSTGTAADLSRSFLCAGMMLYRPA